MTSKKTNEEDYSSSNPRLTTENKITTHKYWSCGLDWGVWSSYSGAA